MRSVKQWYCLNEQQADQANGITQLMLNSTPGECGVSQLDETKSQLPPTAAISSGLKARSAFMRVRLPTQVLPMCETCGPGGIPLDFFEIDFYPLLGAKLIGQRRLKKLITVEIVDVGKINFDHCEILQILGVDG